MNTKPMKIGDSAYFASVDGNGKVDALVKALAPR